jgi:hypothetical protein
MSKSSHIMEEYNEFSSLYSESQSTNKFNLAKKDFELFVDETPNGDIFECKIVDGFIRAMINKKVVFMVELKLLTDEENIFLRTLDGFNYVIKCLKNKIRTEEDFRCLLEGMNR